ncbi:MAG: monovalent cation/H+ antiporter complex subunit F [Candidatus Thiodiazotropha taylori]|uniref:Monovalent cation/H+ antiporter complex subunit F n=1 Tax=Candidatus Thiodiazotropha taylori TaxID=2792791 RepID=A0A9E4K9P5_9GAMM|nr:monovalent cation/H+ antiporter complex subunit F [Candidatus Thiodiazotropha taylori]MCG7956125.1 monovalent cation/H+ antiporter complex subunit F [Candidatus Thiodiazotropha taylori]MCG8054381.1 monovalent cation/H+ antiporter complex subunit F [Candidatus Thiodiazotropha taylori]MCW4241494.1 monovalent cation/H+ antiporter complex subunit F [Candidatus Thiodiazotropha taylori]MCW4255132.1 monovalent cation/H+ antiporter complex subunit F [Candidatus Thiodiazotropha taylori]
MDSLLLLALILLLLSLVLGMVRALKGPTLEDRLLSILLLGTGGVAVLLLLSVSMQLTALLDVGLVLVLLAAVVAAAMTRRESDDA